MKQSKTKISFYRKLFLAYLIDTGTNTVPAIIETTGMPRRTIQDAILGLSEMDISCEFEGAKKGGGYKIKNWGVINKDLVKKHLKHISDVLEYKGD